MESNYVFSISNRTWNNSWALLNFQINFTFLAEQVQFDWTNLLHISNGEAITSL